MYKGIKKLAELILESEKNSSLVRMSRKFILAVF